MLSIDHPAHAESPAPVQPAPVQPTSGTWRYEGMRVVSDAPVGLDATLMPIADVTCAFKSLDEMHANGRLLAQSKRLLQFCRDLQAEYDLFLADESEPFPERLLAVIASRLEDLLASVEVEP